MIACLVQARLTAWVVEVEDAGAAVVQEPMDALSTAPGVAGGGDGLLSLLAPF
jgi:hypothetical protein